LSHFLTSSNSEKKQISFLIGCSITTQMGTKISSLHSVDPYFLESLQGDVFDTQVNYPNPNCKYDNMKDLSTNIFQMFPELVLSDKRRDITLKLRIYYPTIISSKSPIPIIIF